MAHAGWQRIRLTILAKIFGFLVIRYLLGASGEGGKLLWTDYGRTPMSRLKNAERRLLIFSAELKFLPWFLTPFFGPLGWSQKAGPKLVARYGAKSPQGPYFRTLKFNQKIRHKPHFFLADWACHFLGKSSVPNSGPTGIFGETN